MKVIVTGGAGFIGSHTCAELLRDGHSVSIIDNLANASIGVLERIRNITGQDVAFEQADIRSGAVLNTIFERIRPNAVVHFAGLKSVKKSIEKPLQYYDVNIGGTCQLLQAMERVNCQNIVFSSSATVYGAPHYLPYDEAHPTAPVNPYGQTKLMIERLLMDWVGAGQGRTATSLRYFNPVGAHPSGQLGEAPRGVPENLMPFIAQVAKQEREHLSVFGKQYDTKDGTGERDYIHVCDLARAHLLALDHQTKLCGFEVFNIGRGVATSVLELVAAFEHAAGLEIPLRFAPMRQGDLPRYWANPEKAQRELGFHAACDLEQICRDTWNWVCSHDI